MISLILDILFPKKCAGCKRVGSYYCQDCIKNSFQKELICPICTRFAIGGQTHPICKRKFSMDGLWSLGVYQGTLKQAILNLKYYSVSDISQTLVNLIIEYWARHTPFLLEMVKKDPENWVITSVPLHWYRQNRRGFNQSEVLGKLLAKNLGLTYKNLLIRSVYTKTQVGLLQSERRKNIKGVFKINQDEQNLKIILLDDVWTTGSTMKECTYVLKKAGAKTVWGLTLAR